MCECVSGCVCECVCVCLCVSMCIICVGRLGVYVIVVLPPLIQLGQCLSCEVNVTSPNADVLTAEMVDEWLYST